MDAQNPLESRRLILSDLTTDFNVSKYLWAEGDNIPQLLEEKCLYPMKYVYNNVKQ